MDVKSYCKAYKEQWLDPVQNLQCLDPRTKKRAAFLVPVDPKDLSCQMCSLPRSRMASGRSRL